MAEKEASEKKQKRPTAQKRNIQSEKRKVINKSYKSAVRSAYNSFSESVSSKDSGKIQSSLSTLFSLMDKGVKRGVYKLNKANRTKQRAQLKAETAANKK